MRADEVREALHKHEQECASWRSDVRAELVKLKWWLVSLSALGGADIGKDIIKGFL